MPMYTAASPGNLFPKFSAPKMPPGPAGTIARRASLLQSATGVAASEAASACGIRPEPDGALAIPSAMSAAATRPNIVRLIEDLLFACRRSGSNREKEVFDETHDVRSGRRGAH